MGIKDPKLGENQLPPEEPSSLNCCYRDKNGSLSFSGLSLCAWAGVALTFVLGYTVLGGIGAVVLIGALEGGSTALYVYVAVFAAYITAGAIVLIVFEVQKKATDSAQALPVLVERKSDGSDHKDLEN
mmetsp:Transcript_35616/g.69193  ORF Transcript_35616/g.69193 Transcript_35616/m.69193 type:complete len:128 (-) Transcript_35616:303-686(-)